MDFLASLRLVKVLGISVDGDEIDTLDIALHHVVDRIAARAANPDYTDARERLDIRFYLF